MYIGFAVCRLVIKSLQNLVILKNIRTSNFKPTEITSKTRKANFTQHENRSEWIFWKLGISGGHIYNRKNYLKCIFEMIWFRKWIRLLIAAIIFIGLKQSLSTINIHSIQLEEDICFSYPTFRNHTIRLFIVTSWSVRIQSW